MSGIRLRRTMLAATGAAAVAIGLVAGPASAAPGAAAKPATTGSVVAGTPVPGGFASWQELLRMQTRLNDAAARITAATRGADTGFAGIVADPTARQLRVYWKGQAPGALIAAVRASVPVTVLPAAYTQRQLNAAAARLLARDRNRITT
ncbi:MAG TPA: hypothetical protein VJT31_35795, partial [Rugosimonospora sp.]|nr:hypothetical protein [Rugosimonospora sp.]